MPVPPKAGRPSLNICVCRDPVTIPAAPQKVSFVISDLTPGYETHTQSLVDSDSQKVIHLNEVGTDSFSGLK